MEGKQEEGKRKKREKGGKKEKEKENQNPRFHLTRALYPILSFTSLLITYPPLPYPMRALEF